MKIWEGLGYYRRARFLLASAKRLEKNNFKLPRDFKELKKLPGVGDYTANALLALIYNNPTIAFDGNVKRIFSRILNKNEDLLNQDKIKNVESVTFNWSFSCDMSHFGFSPSSTHSRMMHVYYLEFRPSMRSGSSKQSK